MSKEYIKIQELLEKFETTQENAHINQKDWLMLELFGFIPDYSDEEMEKIWQSVFDMQESKAVEFCKNKGVDITKKDNSLVPMWRDITTIFIADDKNLL